MFPIFFSYICLVEFAKPEASTSRKPCNKPEKESLLSQLQNHHARENMEPIAALNQLLKESHKYILTLYLHDTCLHILLQHKENKEDVRIECLPVGTSRESLEEAVFSQPILTRAFEKVFFIADSPRHIFIPESFASTEDNSRYFDFCFPDSNGTSVATVLPQTGVQILFDLDTELHSFIRRTFDRPTLLHRLAPACEYFFKKSRLGYNAKMYAHWTESTIDLFCYNQQGFLLANTFPVHHVNDGIYYILNAWDRLGFDPKDDELSLSGNHEWLRQNAIQPLRKQLSFITLTKFPSYSPAGNEDLPLPLRLISIFSR